MVNPDIWDEFETNADEITKKSAYNNNPEKDVWDQMDVDESWGKSLVRYMMQIPSGVAKIYTWPADVLKMLGQADIEDEDEIRRLRNIAEREGQNPDEFEQKYREGAEKALEMFPTQSRIESLIEEKTGLPLEAKTRGQKALNFLTSARGFIPKNMAVRGTNVGLPKTVSAGAVTATKEGLQEAGVPEPISELASFAILKRPPEGSSALSLGKKTKSSGMPERQFESLKRPTEVSQSKYDQIGEKVRNDFSKILDELIEKTPVGETRKELSSNAKHKLQIAEKFEKVEDLANHIPESFSTKEIKEGLEKRIKSAETTSITPSEYETNYKKFMAKFSGQTKIKEATANDLVKQFRKNNQELAEIFESGKSGSYNRAKKDSYLDYNRLIADAIEKKYPGSEFSELFQESNFQWSKIKDAEFIDSFIDDMFDGKINFKKGEKFYNPKENRQFKKALGEEKFKEFEGLMDDLLSSKQGYSKLKVAKDKGYSDLAKTGIAYVLHPKLAAAKLTKDTIKKIYQSSLDKPKFTLIWKEGLQAFKEGDYAKAQAKFHTLNKQIEKD